MATSIKNTNYYLPLGEMRKLYTKGLKKPLNQGLPVPEDVLQEFYGEHIKRMKLSLEKDKIVLKENCLAEMERLHNLDRVKYASKIRKINEYMLQTLEEIDNTDVEAFFKTNPKIIVK